MQVVSKIEYFDHINFSKYIPTTLNELQRNVE